MEEIEKTRQAYAKKLIIFATPAILALIAIAIGAPLSFISLSSGSPVAFNPMSLVGIGLIFFALFAVISFLVTRKDAKNYKNLYKAYFVGQSLNQTFTDIHYNHSSGMPLEDIRSTDMIRIGNIYKSNDYFTGKYHDVAVRQADVSIVQEYTDSDGNTQYETIFKGRWMIYEFPKKFDFRLQVVQKGFGANKKASKDPTTGRKLKKISTESITFDKKFKIYAEDDFEAYYLLDPAFIDHIEQLSDAQKGRTMFCFKDNQLHIAVYDRKDAFEPPNPFKPINEAKEFSKVKGEIKSVTDYVDFLKLDRKIFQSSSETA